MDASEDDGDVATGPVGATEIAMSDSEIDALLAELADAATTLRNESAAADHDAETWSDASESFIAGSREVRGRSHPRRALVRARHNAANSRMLAYRRSSREVVAWWAHAATYAAVVTAHRIPIDPIMITVGDPTAYLDHDDLPRLPAPSESERSLAILAADMAADPVHGEPPGHMARIAHDAATRIGLRLTVTDNGGPAVFDDISPDGVRARVWGRLWSQHHLPLLPSTDELIDILRAAGPPVAALNEIRAAATAVEEIITAELRLYELERDESADSGVGSEFDQLLSQVNRTTDLLADYARTLTTYLPALRRTTT